MKTETIPQFDLTLENGRWLPKTTPHRGNITVCPGSQGTGKTYRTLHDIVRYMALHPDRKVLIYDINDEFGYDQCIGHGVNINIPVIGTSIEDIQRFTHQKKRIGRILPVDSNGNRLDVQSMKELLKNILTHFRKGLLLIEDINRYLLRIRNIEEVVSILISLRHQNLQSLVKINPLLWENFIIRMHWQIDSLERIKGLITNYRLYKIAQLLVNTMHVHDKRFFCYIYPRQNKISFVKSQS